MRPLPTICSLLVLGAVATAQTTVHPLVTSRAQISVIAGSSTGAPSGRMWGGSATDGTSMFVFGGRLSSSAGNAGSTYYNGLYAYNPTTNAWSTLSAEGAAGAPGNRFRMAMAHDPSGNRLVIFGGSALPGAASSDCYAFDLGSNTWSQIPNPTPGTTGPSDRYDARMVYDAATGSIVLFGGDGPASGASDRLGDTWQLNGTTWTQLAPATSPSARALFAMTARSAPYGDIVLVAGRDAGNVIQNDTWRWDGAGLTWVQINPINSSAPVSWASGNEAVYDSVRQVVVILGGPGTSVAPSNTGGAGGWHSEYDCVTNEWRGFGANTTSQSADDPTIGRLQRFFMTFLNGKTYFWHGQNPASTGDSTLTSVKEYQASPLASATAYGTGCAGLGLTAGSNPWGGRDWTLTGTGFTVTSVGAVVISLAQVSTPLPAPGLAGCDLLVDSSLTLASVLLLPSAGSASYTLAVPLDATFGGLPLNSQMFALDAGAVTSSNGIAGVLGAN